MSENIYLVAVRLYNCQSHADTIYRFSTDKVNVIFGDNGVGKSVFFKMLKASLNPQELSEKDRTDLIRRKTEFAQIQYIFSDNSSTACRVYRKGVVFQYRDSPESKPIVTNIPHEKFLEKLNILMDEQSGFTTNIIDGDNDRLLVNSNLKSNYHFLKLIVNNEDIENLMEKIPLKMGEAQKLQEKLNNRLNYVNQRLDVIKYVDEEILAHKVKKMESCNDVLYKGIDIFKYLQSLKISVTEKKDFSYLLQKTEILQKVFAICKNLYKINFVEHFKSEILDLCESTEKIFKIYKPLTACEIPNEDKVLLNQKSLDIIEILRQICNVEHITPFIDYTPMIKKMEILFDISEKLSQLKILPKQQYENIICFLELNENVLAILKKLKHLQNIIKLFKTSEKQYTEILSKLKESNAIVHCPVYGEVVFDEHGCTTIT